MDLHRTTGDCWVLVNWTLPARLREQKQYILTLSLRIWGQRSRRTDWEMVSALPSPGLFPRPGRGRVTRMHQARAARVRHLGFVHSYQIALDSSVITTHYLASFALWAPGPQRRWAGTNLLGLSFVCNSLRSEYLAMHLLRNFLLDRSAANTSTELASDPNQDCSLQINHFFFKKGSHL